MLAFELARRVPTAHLFVSGRRAPSCPRDERVHLRDDDGLIAAMQELNGTSSALLHNKNILRVVLPAVRADYRAAETYRYADGPGVTAPTSVFLGDNDPMVTPGISCWTKNYRTGIELEDPEASDRQA